MGNGKSGCCNKPACLCPLSFGLALGITCALAVFLWGVWVMYYGVPASIAHMALEPITWLGLAKNSGWCLLKGFVFGFVLIFIYDMIACYGKKWCGRKDKCADGSCSCCK